MLGITKADFIEQGLPAAYYKELQKSIKDMNNFISKTDDTNHLTESELRELWDAAIKATIEVEPLYAQ